MTEVQYPNTTFNIFDGTESTTITPQSVVVGESVYSTTTSITPTSIIILDDDPSFPSDMTILQDSIVSSETGSTKLIQINKTGFFATDETGNANGVLEGNIYATKADGTYINIDPLTGININGDYGNLGQVLQKSNPANALVWGATPFQDTADDILDMNEYGIENVLSIDAISGADLNMNGQVVFNTPPHIPDPILGNDAASKGYVDTLIGNYSGNGLSLYFNYATAQTDPIIAPSVGELQQTLAPINSPTTDNFYTMRSVALGTNTLISTFTTDVGFPNTLTIPTGLWSMLVWGYTSAQTGQLYYHFHLNEVNSAGAFVAQIGTSGYSSDVNAINSADPDAYHCSLALVAPYTMASVSNRLQIQIYTTGTGAVPTYLYTLFGGDYYSNVTSTLNGGTSLLTQNNTWTGVNNFTAGFLTGGVDSAVAGTLDLGTTNSTLTTIGSTTNPTAINALNLRININGNTGSAGQLLTAVGTPSAGVAFQNPKFVPTADQALNMVTYGITGSSMDSATTLSLGTTNATTTTLGRSGNTATAINGTAVNIANATGATSTINILNGGATTAGSVNIASVGANSTNITIGSSTGTGVVNILGGAGNSVNIANGAGARTITIGNTTNVLQLANVQLNNNLISGATSFTNTAANIVFGSSGRESTMNGNVVISSASGTFTMGLNKHINLNSANTALPTLNQLGYVVREAVQTGTTTLAPNTYSTLATYASIPAGTWLFTTSYYVNATGVDTASFSISTTTSENQWAVTGFSCKPASGNYGQVSGMITITAATSSVYFLGQSSTASTNITNIRTTRTRIA